MEMTKNQRKINWYRCPLPRETLNALNQRSDFWGLLQTLGHLGLLAATGAGAWYAAEHLALPWLLLILFFHGTFYAFLLNGFHELCHSTVFKSKFLNYFFLRLFSFLGGYNHIHFWTSHAEHHKYTLHPPDDLEVVLPAQLRFLDFLKSAIVNPWGLYAPLQDDGAAGIREIREANGSWRSSPSRHQTSGDGSFAGIASCWWGTA